MEIVSGRDRLAATLLNKTRRLWVHLVDATADERSDLEESENLFRRPIENRAELLARRVAKVAETLTVTASQGGTVSQPSGQSIKAAARKQVAAEAGVSPAAVRKAEQRTQSKQVQEAEAPVGALRKKHGTNDAPDGAGHVEGPADVPDGDDVLPGEESASPAIVPPVRMLGLACPPAWRASVAAVAAEVDEIDQLLQQAQGRATRLLSSGLPIFAEKINKLKTELHRAAHATRTLRPEVVCPWCRDPDGTGGQRAKCASCMGDGYLTREQADRVPEAQLYEGPRRANAAPSGSAPKRRGMQIVVVRDDGAETPFIDPES
jgi:hypothetical protein